MCQSSSTGTSWQTGEYAATDDTQTTLGTPAAPAAASTRPVPTALAAQVTSGRRVGWNRHARWTTASAEENVGARSSVETSSSTHVTPSGCRAGDSGDRRLSPTTSCPAATSSPSVALPRLPVAPVTTTRMAAPYPMRRRPTLAVG